MYNKLLIPAFLILLTIQLSCKKDGNPKNGKTTISVTASSNASMDIQFAVSDASGKEVNGKYEYGVKSFQYEFAEAVNGQKLMVNIQTRTVSEINATLKINGVSINPTTYSANSGGKTVKFWERDINE